MCKHMCMRGAHEWKSKADCIWASTRRRARPLARLRPTLPGLRLRLRLILPPIRRRRICPVITGQHRTQLHRGGDSPAAVRAGLSRGGGGHAADGLLRAERRRELLAQQRNLHSANGVSGPQPSEETSSATVVRMRSSSYLLRVGHRGRVGLGQHLHQDLQLHIPSLQQRLQPRHLLVRVLPRAPAVRIAPPGRAASRAGGRPRAGAEVLFTTQRGCRCENAGQRGTSSASGCAVL